MYRVKINSQHDAALSADKTVRPTSEAPETGRWEGAVAEFPEEFGPAWRSRKRKVFELTVKERTNQQQIQRTRRITRSCFSNELCNAPMQAAGMKIGHQVMNTVTVTMTMMMICMTVLSLWKVMLHVEGSQLKDLL